MEKIAIIRIRGYVEAPYWVKDTLYILRLRRTNVCVVYDKRKDIIGMVKVVEPWVAWGEIRKDVFKQLLLKRGRFPGDKRVTEEEFQKRYGITIDDFIEKFWRGEVKLKDYIKPFFRLHPPRGGYRSIKLPKNKGGAWGYWGEEINDLIFLL